MERGHPKSVEPELRRTPEQALSPKDQDPDLTEDPKHGGLAQRPPRPRFQTRCTLGVPLSPVCPRS